MPRSNAQSFHGVCHVLLYNLGGHIIIVRTNSKLARGEITYATDGVQRDTITTEQVYDSRLRIKGNIANEPLLRDSNEVQEQDNGRTTYDNGLVIAKKLTESVVEATYTPKNAVKGTITIEVPDSHTLVTVDGCSVDLWLC